MHNLLLILFIFITSISFAQPSNAKIVTVEGKQYYEHIVEAGNTLWGLQSIYKVDADKILKENPEVSDGLKVGQKILIPIERSTPVKPVKTVEYKVQKGETLYGLSRKFNLTVDDLIELTPALKDGLKKGQVINVPYIGETEKNTTELKKEEQEAVPNPFVREDEQAETFQEVKNEIKFSDSTINHVVLAHETMYSISKRFMVSIDAIMKLNGLRSSNVKEGQVLIIPVKKFTNQVGVKEVPGKNDNSNGNEPIEFTKKGRYQVAVMLPFHLDYGPSYSEYVSDISTQFYMGAKLALDELDELGLKADVRFYDTKNDSATVMGIMKSSAFKEVDLVIGPLMNKTLSLVADFCKEEKIRLVCPVSSHADLLEGNQLVYASVPSNITLMEAMARQMAAKYQNDKILLIKPLDEESVSLYESFRKAYNDADVNGNKPVLVETTIDGFNVFIKRGVNTRMVVPSTSKTTALKFMNNLNRSSFRSKADDLFVYGTKEWVDFTDINNEEQI